MTHVSTVRAVSQRESGHVWPVGALTGPRDSSTCAWRLVMCIKRRCAHFATACPLRSLPNPSRGGVRGGTLNASGAVCGPVGGLHIRTEGMGVHGVWERMGVQGAIERMGVHGAWDRMQVHRAWERMEAYVSSRGNRANGSVWECKGQQNTWVCHSVAHRSIWDYMGHGSTPSRRREHPAGGQAPALLCIAALLRARCRSARCVPARAAAPGCIMRALAPGRSAASAGCSIA